MKIKILQEKDFRRIERSLLKLWFMVNNGAIKDSHFIEAIDCISAVATELGIEIE